MKLLRVIFYAPIAIAYYVLGFVVGLFRGLVALAFIYAMSCAVDVFDIRMGATKNKGHLDKDSDPT